MDLCSENHDEIVHEERKCPLCECIEELEEAKGKILDMEIQVEELEKEVQELEKGEST